MLHLRDWIPFRFTSESSPQSPLTLYVSRKTFDFQVRNPYYITLDVEKTYPNLL
ncbi:hypothetical protein N9N24_05010 [Candidatus Marinimicrobia bacterium]|nr:hypothetical protein [Candidatus Neomarinimicrobiota bacterium]